ncbi:MAG: hypothetical protein II098_08535 [Treponema sp.]|nr:hypothetical protein [Treponema sp.]
MTKKKIKNILFFFTSILFLNSCGMDAVYYLYAPTATYSVPTITSANYLNPGANYETAYFSFKTQQTQNSKYTETESSFQFLGTAIYYRIYNNYETMNSDISAISGKISSTNEASAASYIVETLKYQQLKASGTNNVPLIPVNSTNTNDTVYIRLTNYQSEPMFRARIIVGQGCETGTVATGCVELGTPLRTGSEGYNFDFGRKQGAENKKIIPQSGDSDVTISSTAKASGVWYVALYAIGVGQDESMTAQYSNALHLGAVAISETDENN